MHLHVNIRAKANDQPWMTKEIRQLLSKRDKLRDISLSTKIPEDRETFRQYRNKVKQTIRNAKIRY